MTLHMEIRGRGRPLVMLHGWGSDSGIWTALAERLARSRRVHLVDLPGNGYSRHRALGSLNALVDEVARTIPDDALVAGWSMGGLVAQRLARRHPGKVRALAVIARTPRVVAPQGLAHRLAASSHPRLPDRL